MQTRHLLSHRGLLRRSVLASLAALPALSGCVGGVLTAPGAPDARPGSAFDPVTRFDALERSSGGRLGVAAIDIENSAHIAWRQSERFPMCSTFKVLLVAAILQRSRAEALLLQSRVAFSDSDLVPYSPVTGKRIGTGMTIGELCAAALQHSDNTAANLLLKELGGPSAVTAYARSIGDVDSRLDRRETELNSAIPGDLRDTSTPYAMARNLRRLLLGDALAPSETLLLQSWMRGNMTGGERIRAGVPDGWNVADKTGSGDYGTTNDIGVAWSPSNKPIVLAVYFTQKEPTAGMRSDVIAAATRIVVEAFT